MRDLTPDQVPKFPFPVENNNQEIKIENYVFVCNTRRFLFWDLLDIVGVVQLQTFGGNNDNAAAWIDVQSDTDNREGSIFDIPQKNIPHLCCPQKYAKNNPCVIDIDPW